jgi:hypothetical protein
MEKTIAACGLDCAACPAYIASMTNDEELRKKTAAEWTKSFGFDCKPEMVNCHGCFATDGVQIGHCSDCGIRLCVVSKDMKSCAACAGFGCEKTAEFWKSAPEAKKNLEALRS